MSDKRTATATAATVMPLEVIAPSGVLGVLDDLSSMILGRMAIDRKLQAILETLSDHIEVDCARFVLDCRLADEAVAGDGSADCRDEQLAAELKDYPTILE